MLQGLRKPQLNDTLSLSVSFRLNQELIFHFTNVHGVNQVMFALFHFGQPGKKRNKVK